MENSIYTKRLQLLECKWNQLMQEQSEMDMQEICSDEFQAKRQRIGNLYHRVMNTINEPKRKAVVKILESINPNLSNMPVGKLTLNF